MYQNHYRCVKSEKTRPFEIDSIVMRYTRKPRAFKPGDEWHPFGAEPG